MHNNLRPACARECPRRKPKGTSGRLCAPFQTPGGFVPWKGSQHDAQDDKITHRDEQQRASIVPLPFVRTSASSTSPMTPSLEAPRLSTVATFPPRLRPSRNISRPLTAGSGNRLAPRPRRGRLRPSLPSWPLISELAEAGPLSGGTDALHQLQALASVADYLNKLEIQAYVGEMPAGGAK
jgi:hypothetical protein